MGDKGVKVIRDVGNHSICGYLLHIRQREREYILFIPVPLYLYEGS